MSVPTPTHTTNCPGVNLAGVDLHGFDFDYADLAGADLQGAYLPGASFNHADLSGADLTSAYADGVSMNETDVMHARLTNVYLGDAWVLGSDFTSSDLSHMVGGLAHYDGSIFTDVTAPGLEMFESSVRDVVFSGADIQGGDFTASDLTGTSFSGADLTSGRVDSSTLTGVDFTNAHLGGVLFGETVLSPANQRVYGEDLSGGPVSWSTPSPLPGARPGACHPPSGSHFALGQVTVLCDVTDDYGANGVGSFVVTVISPELFMYQWPASQSVLSGASVSFSAAGFGASPSVTWEVSSDGGATWSPVSGGTISTTQQFPATLSTFTFVAAPADNGHQYQVLYTNAFGTAIAGPATLTVSFPPTPTVLPGVGSVVEGNSDTTVAAGAGHLVEPVGADRDRAVVHRLRARAPPATMADPGDRLPASPRAPSPSTPVRPAASVTILVNGDTLVEPDEYIVVSFHDPTNATMGGFWGLGLGIITNDDHATVLPGSGTVAAPTSGTADLVVPVTLSNPSTQTITVQWTTLYIPGNPTDPWLGPQAPTSDYIASSGTITFAPGQTSAQIHIPVLADSSPGPDEHLVISFHDPTNATMAASGDSASASSPPRPDRHVRRSGVVSRGSWRSSRGAGGGSGGGVRERARRRAGRAQQQNDISAGHRARGLPGSRLSVTGRSVRDRF